MALSWALQRVRIAECWQAGWTGAGIRVGHLDTGVDAAHPALAGRVATFAAFDHEGALQPGVAPHDSGYHGTHTAALICGGQIDGTAIGAAPGAQLCAGQVIEGGHVLARVLAGIDWLLTCELRVVVLVLGVPGYTPVLEQALARLRRRGALVICPIGNGGCGASCSPANYAGVLAVGAIDCADRVAPFSGGDMFRRATATKPDLLAPGVAVASATPGGGSAQHDGTSMAAACVAGVAALLFQAYPDATPDAVAQALCASAEPLADAPLHRQGHGVANAAGALARLAQWRDRSDTQR